MWLTHKFNQRFSQCLYSSVHGALEITVLCGTVRKKLQILILKKKTYHFRTRCNGDSDSSQQVLNS